MASDIEIKRALETEILPFVRTTGKSLVGAVAVLEAAVNELRARMSQLEICVHQGHEESIGRPPSAKPPKKNFKE